jgi:hypothetical protein
MRGGNRTAYLGEEWGDVSSLESPSAIEEVRNVARTIGTETRARLGAEEGV